MKRKLIHKNALFSFAGISLSLLLLSILFFMGHTTKESYKSCTGVVKSIENNLINVQILTGTYKDEITQIPCIASQSIPAVGETVALQVKKDKEILEGNLINGFAEYETGTIKEILQDSCEKDPIAEDAYRGEQTLAVHIQSGQYSGLDFVASNTVGPMYNQPMKVGDKVSVIISTNSDGSTHLTIYEYHRLTAVYILVILFALSTVLVGGKTGLKSLLGLALTLISLLFILLPLLLKGYPTLLTTFVICVAVTILSLILLSGSQKKTVCAILGTISGMLIALVFAWLASKLTRIDGLRMEYAEPLLQLRQTGSSTIGIRNILTASVMISALGAVMDVAMSISSSIVELNTVNSSLTHKQLWSSGMSIARDMVGTMTNTLILAIFGNSLMLIIYLYSLELPLNQLMNSSYLSLELISSIASSMGIILSVPLTVIMSVLIVKK